MDLRRGLVDVTITSSDPDRLTYRRFTQAQGLFNASLFVLILTTPINILLNYLFVFVLDWDLTGAALSTVVSNTLLPIFLWVYVYFIAPSSLKCWGGFTRAALTNWGPMCKLSVSGIIMTEAEWLAFDILSEQFRTRGGQQRALTINSFLRILPFHRAPRRPKCYHNHGRYDLPHPIQH